MSVRTDLTLVGGDAGGGDTDASAIELVSGDGCGDDFGRTSLKVDWITASVDVCRSAR